MLGTLNMGAFFVLIYLAAQLLPTSIASTVMATSPVAMMLLVWALVSERPRVADLAGAAVGIAGVCLLLITGVTAFNSLGLAASAAAMVMSSVGYILAKRWSGDADILSTTSWQLIASGWCWFRSRSLSRARRRCWTRPPSSHSATSRFSPRRWHSPPGLRDCGIFGPGRWD